MGAVGQRNGVMLLRLPGGGKDTADTTPMYLFASLFIAYSPYWDWMITRQ